MTAGRTSSRAPSVAPGQRNYGANPNHHAANAARALSRDTAMVNPLIRTGLSQIMFDILAVLAGIAFICVTAAAIGTALFILLFVKL